MTILFILKTCYKTRVCNQEETHNGLPISSETSGLEPNKKKAHRLSHTCALICAYWPTYRLLEEVLMHSMDRFSRGAPHAYMKNHLIEVFSVRLVIVEGWEHFFSPIPCIWMFGAFKWFIDVTFQSQTCHYTLRIKPNPTVGLIRHLQKTFIYDSLCMRKNTVNSSDIQTAL